MTMNSWQCIYVMWTFVSPLAVTEDIVYSGCSFPRGNYQLPAGSAGCEVFPASEVAVYGAGWSTSTQE